MEVHGVVVVVVVGVEDVSVFVALPCQLLKDNLYEFQKFLMTGKEPAFFTLPRLQVPCCAMLVVE